MKFLIATVVIACAVAAFAAPEPAGPAFIPPVREPTISPGDINGAAADLAAEIGDAQVVAEDVQNDAIDKARLVADHTSELQQQAIDAADDQAWQAVDDVKTTEARLDGAAAATATLVAKQLVRANGVLPARVPAPVVTPGIPAVTPAPVSITPSPSGFTGAPIVVTPAPFRPSAVTGAPATYPGTVAPFIPPRYNIPRYPSVAGPAVAASYNSPVVVAPGGYPSSLYNPSSVYNPYSYYGGYSNYYNPSAYSPYLGSGYPYPY